VKSVRFGASGQEKELAEADVPEPQPGAGEVRIRVHAAGVTPTELGWYPTTHRKDGSPRLGAIPSHEFSGVVDAVGEGIANQAVGQEVYGMNDWFAEGATAEYCLAQPDWIAPKPIRLTHEETASVPISALTAWQGLFDRARLGSGERVLVHGGAGAVGIFAIQLARYQGASVVATASARDRDFVTNLGAVLAIDYHAQRFEDLARDIDVVFDTVGGETLERSWSVLRPGGRMVTIAANGEATDDPRVKEAFFIVEPRREQLVEVATLLDDGVLRAFVSQVVPLSEAPAAYSGKRGGHGKVVVSILPS
jgi:NADPH:quinone reductase-like Zn-dependent oxidoreductase